MNKLLIATLVSLTLAGCGGGGSDKNTAAEPPAPQIPTDNDAGNGGEQPTEPQKPQEPQELSVSCSKQPANSVKSGKDAKATFSFTKAINATGTLRTMCLSNSGNIGFPNKSIDVISGQALAKQTAPASCEGKTLQMNLFVADKGLSATCSWSVTKSVEQI